MFKGLQDTSRSPMFRGFPNLNFQMNNEAYGFSGCTVWLDAAYGLNTQTDLAAVSSWVDRIRDIKFEQTTAGNQPRLVVADANFNNYPTIDFSVSVTRQLKASYGWVTFGTIAFIAKVTTIGFQNILLCNDNLTNSGRRILLAGNGSASNTGIGMYSGLRTTQTAELVTAIEDTATHIVVMTPERIIVDGVEEVIGSILWNTFNTIGTTANADSLTGQVAEIIGYSDLLTSEQCISLSGNINSKYVIY